jgi:Mg2+ and Co2+ transporter CorA
LTASNFNDPIAKLEDNLQRELADLQDLRDNANTLVSRTIQLVNIRLEDHGKAILVFTVVTIIFLPLNFVTSFFGMNTRDIRDMTATQSLFWLVAICVTVGVLGASIFLAFQGGEILERLHLWLDAKRERTANANTTLPEVPANLRMNPIDRGNIFKL